MAPTSKICRTDDDDEKRKQDRDLREEEKEEREKERNRRRPRKSLRFCETPREKGKERGRSRSRKSLRLRETPRGKNVNAILSCLQCRFGTRMACSACSARARARSARLVFDMYAGRRKCARVRSAFQPVNERASAFSRYTWITYSETTSSRRVALESSI